jgi:hypothetical protein
LLALGPVEAVAPVKAVVPVKAVAPVVPMMQRLAVRPTMLAVKVELMVPVMAQGCRSH